jgi:hypothetical protein
MAARTCNGAGTCLIVLPVSCAPYACGSDGACRISCGSDADCLAPNVCLATRCVPPGTGGTGGGGGGAGGAGGAAGTGGVGGGGGGGAAGSGGTSGGAGGSAGTGGGGAAGGGGTGGSAGASGNGGSAGTGGAAGAAGAAGAGGGAGTGATGGAGGRGGAGGSAGAAGAGGAGCAGYAFCDDFEDGDTVGWTPNGGTWSVISDGSRVYQGGNGSAFSLAGQSTWTDQTITARVKVLQFGGASTSYRAGIVARATDASNLYVFAIDASGALRLLKGTSSPSGTGATGTCGKVTPSPAAAANTWYTMQLKIAGTGGNVTLTTFFNGTMIHSCQTTMAALPSGAAGTYIYGPNTIAEFDDVKISTP